MKKLLYATILGWSLSALVFILSVAKINIQEKIPFVWILFFGAFIVFIPAIFYAKNSNKIQEYSYDNNTFGNVPLMPFFEKSKSWIITVLITSFICAVVSFSSMNNLQNGSVENINGKYFIYERDNDEKREISKSEFDNFETSNLKFFFGGLLIFYSIPMLVYSKLIEWKNDEANG